MKADRYNDPFPTRLRELMEGRDVTQLVLADAAGVRRQTISAYADGSADPTLPRLVAMADFFGVSLGYLAGREPAKAPENNEIMKRLSISEEAIKRLEGFARRGFDDSMLAFAPLLLDALLTTDSGRTAFSAMSRYVFLDADKVYKKDESIKEGVSSIEFCIGYDCDIDDFVRIPISSEELVDSFLLTVPALLKKVREDVKHRERERVQSNVNPEDSE